MHAASFGRTIVAGLLLYRFFPSRGLRVRDGLVGAIVTALLPDGRRLVQEVHAGSSYLSSEDPRVHFGLGGATKVARLIVRYPGGRTTRLDGVAADRIVSAP